MGKFSAAGLTRGIHEHLRGFMKRHRHGGILREILEALTRYSANDPELPVNDPALFTG
jgi:hypothetical protein